jgi:O-antigen ligase
MWLASLFVRQDAMIPRFPLRVTAAVAGVSGAMLGGRRAIIMGLLIIPIVAWLVKRTTRVKSGPRKVNPTFVVASLLLIIPVVLALPKIASMPIITDSLQATVSFFSNSTPDIRGDEYVRTYQVERLLGAFADSPIWGHGLGATIAGYQRSERQPWQFEMQYPALLMQTGLIGVAFLAVIAILVVRAVIMASALRPDLLPSLIVTLCGGAAMLIANATNPYLQAPAHYWAIFLPLAVINLMLRTRPGEIRSSLPAPRAFAVRPAR